MNGQTGSGGLKIAEGDLISIQRRDRTFICKVPCLRDLSRRQVLGIERPIPECGCNLKGEHLRVAFGVGQRCLVVGVDYRGLPATTDRAHYARP